MMLILPSCMNSIEIELDVDNVSCLKPKLQHQRPDIYESLFDLNGKPYGFLNFYLNDSCITTQLDNDIRLGKDDYVEIITSVAGG